ncbi:nicotinamide n-methyltransferase [Diplodia corticola]|uniref:Protein N-terminal and lysine N-methyltransferase EFM7 n=1 Tax=Diplodia corticola TaxID=236234 RepID=A0A1J9RZS6_9PEZI|nr:nicotinamide n-methyltransferase [Diplodia corticola]OJD33276.1 nicotinamide n-methyltransferase [Diplodia corticola]
MSSDDEAAGLDLFQEPEGYFQPEKPPTYATHKLESGEELKVRLVGFNPLWGHHIWNAARTISRFLETLPQQDTATIRGRTVLELGAGAGLPSLVCALGGAARVVCTDYPDADLVDNLRRNAAEASPEVAAAYEAGVLRVEGYLWGADPAVLLGHLRGVDGPEGTEGEGFDVVILADLLFNHSEHGKLVESVRRTLKREGDAVAYVFFSPYRPWLLERDLAFFDLARDGGLRVRKLGESVMEKVMFEEDPGDELLRRTVFSYELRWADLVGDEDGQAEKQQQQ